ncbi:MAG: hypothetical protein J6S76_05240 [Clostridia bacterium]|nr:hypothetical protein [Clostridia bacterium]
MDNNKVIRRGTPTVDGILDDKYKESFHITMRAIEDIRFYATDEDTAKRYMANTYGTSYYLYDDSYIYVCSVVHDETICSRGSAWRMQEVWPWNDDGAEVYLWFSDEDCMAIHCDAHGIRGVIDVHIWGDHVSSGVYRDLPAEDWAATIDTESKTYVIEFRFPLPTYVKEGSEVGSILEIDDRWAVGEGTENMVGALFGVPRITNLPEHRAILGK